MATRITDIQAFRKLRGKAAAHKTVPSVYTACDKEAEGAIPLYDGIGKDGKICRYVVKTEGSEAPAAADRYFLCQSDKSGGGDGFGGESNNLSTDQECHPIKGENLVFDADGVTVLGYVYRGVYNYYSNGDSDRYSRDIFLPLNGLARYTDYKYSYTVYPQDGTSSSSSSSKYTRLVSR